MVQWCRTVSGPSRLGRRCSTKASRRSPGSGSSCDLQLLEEEEGEEGEGRRTKEGEERNARLLLKGQLKCRPVSGRLENHDIHESLTLLYHGTVNRPTKTEDVHQRNPFKTLYRDWSVAQFGQNWYKMKP